MDDQRVRDFETALWIGGEEVYRRSIDPKCLMVVPAAPFVMSGSETIDAVSKTPRWESVEFDNLRIARPEEGLIVLAYGVRASRGEEAYGAYCSSTYRRVGHEQWQVVQHQQTPAPAGASRSRQPSDESPAAARGHGAGSMEQAQKEAAEDRKNDHGYQ